MKNQESTACAFFYPALLAIFLGFLSISHELEAQPLQPGSGIPLTNSWGGGLNSCQFCAIDLNIDGIKDLLIFDRHGNRKLTFINHGTPNKIDYIVSSQYALQLPTLHDWVITADYNCDGKMDLFTYSKGGVRVFENISDTVLKFKLITDLLESYYYSGKVGILVTSVDYPALADIDNDGDLDLLTFFGFGSYVEYHKNQSMEKYGHCDSLDFKLADPCWGKFKESEGGNRILLNVACKWDKTLSGVADSRHRGSTLLAIDLNNDGLKDLILGDVDYPGLVALYNGGTHDSAFMVAQDTAFPSASSPVHLFSFPVVSYLDINNDGFNDMLISPFDPSLHTSDNYNCVWFYKNTGTNALPLFEKQPEQLFRNEMMDFGSASHPVLYDFDADGLQDLFVGNYGVYDSSYYFQAKLHSVYRSQIAYFKNSGTVSAPLFVYQTDNLAGIASMGLLGAYPALGDLNGDGHTDMVVGNSDGTLMLFINNGKLSGIPEFKAAVMNWQQIKVGGYSAPQLFDLDKDNMPELVVGQQNGKLSYYENNGTVENPLFTLITDSLGGVNVTNFNLSYDGFSTPCFSRMPDGNTFLLAGSEEGRIHYFEDIDNNLDGKFTSTAGLYDWLSSEPGDTLFGWQTSPAIGHLTDHEAYDLITGNFSGGLNYITKRLPAAIIPGTFDTGIILRPSLMIFPNPANQEVTIGSQVARMLNSESKLTITNLLGSTILELPYNGVTTISVANTPPGTYFIRIGTATAKVVILHP